jgi:hypothetical protein
MIAGRRKRRVAEMRGDKRIDRYRLMVWRIPFEQSGQRVVM